MEKTMIKTRSEPKALVTKVSAVHEAAMNSSYEDDAGDEQRMNYYIQSYSVYAWVYASISAIANAAAGIPILLYEVDAEGELTEIMDHPILSMLNKPNKYMTRHDLIQKSFTYLEAAGNCFWELAMNKAGMPTEIYPLNPKNMKIKPDKKEFIAGYEYNVNGKDVNFEPQEIIHLKYPDPNNEYWGLSSLSAGKDALDQEKNSIAWNKAFFKNSARPDLVFHVNSSLGKNAFARMKASIKKLYGGVNKAHSAAIVEGGVKVETLGFAQKDLEFLELRKFNRAEILSVFGVPPCIVGVFESAIRANAEEQRKFFWETTMVQKLMKVEMALNQFLVPLFTKNTATKLQLSFDLSDVEALGEQADVRATRLLNLSNGGIISRNEARLELGYEPIEGLDTIYVPLGGSTILDSESQQPNQQDSEDRYLAIGNSPFLSKEQKEILWKSIDGPRAELITTAVTDYQKYFERLEKRTLENLKELFKSGIANIITKEKKVDVSSVYATKKEAEILAKIISKQLLSSVRISGNVAIIDIGIEIGRDLASFEADKQRVKDFVEQSSFDHATSISSTTRDMLKRQLSIALDKEEGVDDIAARISKILGAEGAGSRSKIIAENEIGSAMNAGRRFGVKQILEDNPDVNLFKVWISAHDEKVRTTHELNDTISNRRPLPINKSYPNGLMFPKDPNGPPEEVINCRCVESYVSGTKFAKMLGGRVHRKVRLTTGLRVIKRSPYLKLRKVKARN